MSARAIRHCLQLMAAWTLCACDGVGAPLVDLQPHDNMSANPPLCMPPPCESMPGEPIADRPSPTHPAACPSGVDAPLGAGTDADAGVGNGADAINALDDLPLGANCKSLHYDQVATDKAIVAPSVSLAAASWSRLELVLTSEAPRELTLRDATLNGVFVRLVGPVVLRIEQPKQLFGLFISGAPNERGAPRVELVGAEGSDVLIGDTNARFEGSVVLTKTKLRQSQLDVATLQLESSVLVRSIINVHTVDAIDLDFDTGTINADTARLSTFIARHLRIRGCADLAFFGAELHATAVETCEDGGLIRLYTSNVLSTWLDGQIESDHTDMEGVRIGATLPTEIAIFGGNTSASTFCGGVTKGAFGYDADVHCVACDPSFEEPQVACAVPSDLPPRFRDNYCPVLASKIPLATCEDPRPERTRPVQTEQL